MKDQGSSIDRAVQSGVDIVGLRSDTDINTVPGDQGFVDSRCFCLRSCADRLVGFTGVVEVSQGWEVFDLLGGLIKLIVFLKFPMQYIDNLPAAQTGISDLLSLEADSAEH